VKFQSTQQNKNKKKFPQNSIKSWDVTDDMALSACCRAGGGRRRRFLLYPPETVSRAELAKRATLVGFGQVRPFSHFLSVMISFLFLLISVFDFD
jgi:hypothetical protein